MPQFHLRNAEKCFGISMLSILITVVDKLKNSCIFVWWEHLYNHFHYQTKE